MSEKLSKHETNDGFEPKIHKYEDGNSALVYDVPGETIGIGDDKYFCDPQDDPSSMLRFEGLRDDDTKVDVFLNGNDAVVVRTFKDESTPQAVDFMKNGDSIHGNQYRIGDKIPLPVYGRYDVTLTGVSAEYKEVGSWSSSDDVKKGKSPFAQIRRALEHK